MLEVHGLLCVVLCYGTYLFIYHSPPSYSHSRQAHGVGGTETASTNVRVVPISQTVI